MPELDSGREFAGTLNAVDVSAATILLESLKLKVLGIWPSGAAVRSKPLGPADFKSFNQQLSLLVKAGLPIEDGLKLLVADMHRGRLASAIAQISQELDAGELRCRRPWKNTAANSPPLMRCLSMRAFALETSRTY